MTREELARTLREALARATERELEDARRFILVLADEARRDDSGAVRVSGPRRLHYTLD
jgi:hypothetical protein